MYNWQKFFWIYQAGLLIGYTVYLSLGYDLNIEFIAVWGTFWIIFPFILVVILHREVKPKL